MGKKLKESCFRVNCLNGSVLNVSCLSHSSVFVLQGDAFYKTSRKQRKSHTDHNDIYLNHLIRLNSGISVK